MNWKERKRKRIEKRKSENREGSGWLFIDILLDILWIFGDILVAAIRFLFKIFD